MCNEEMKIKIAYITNTILWLQLTLTHSISPSLLIYNPFLNQKKARQCIMKFRMFSWSFSLSFIIILYRSFTKQGGEIFESFLKKIVNEAKSGQGLTTRQCCLKSFYNTYILHVTWKFYKAYVIQRAN